MCPIEVYSRSGEVTAYMPGSIAHGVIEGQHIEMISTGAGAALRNPKGIGSDQILPEGSEFVTDEGERIMITGLPDASLTIKPSPWDETL